MKEVIKERQGLYRQEFEHDNCGIGAVVNIKGKKSHDTVANALRIVENLDHRAWRFLSEMATALDLQPICRKCWSFLQKGQMFVSQ